MTCTAFWLSRLLLTACARGHLGGFGAQFGDGGGLGGRGFFGGRKLGSGELQLVILALFKKHPGMATKSSRRSKKPRRASTRRARAWSIQRSPISRRWALRRSKPRGARSSTRSRTGRTKLTENRALVDAILAQLARVGSKMERVRQAFAGEESGGRRPSRSRRSTPRTERRAHRQAQRFTVRRECSACRTC